jgi:hypothetical protein
MYDDCYCINCGCRPLVYHMRDQHEPDGKQPWKGPGSVVVLKPKLTQREYLQRALASIHTELRGAS